MKNYSLFQQLHFPICKHKRGHMLSTTGPIIARGVLFQIIASFIMRGTLLHLSFDQARL